MNRKLMTLLLGIGLSASLAALPAHAQQGPGNGGPGNGGQGGGPGGPGGFRRGGGFQQMMQRRMDNIKQALGATDDEWAALQPKIEAIQQAQFQSRMGGMMRRGRGGPGGPGGDQSNNPMFNNPVATAMRDLQTTLENKDATPDQIKTKLQAVRDARQKSEADLKQKQDDLKQLLTVRQEAVLVSEGILD